MTTDLEDRLRADLPRLADVITQAPVSRAQSVAAFRPPPQPRRRVVVAAVAACLALAAIATVVSLRRHQGATVTSQPAADGGALGTWRTLPPSPLGPRGRPVTVWTGTEVLVWGGYRGDPSAPLAFQSGAAYDPATNSWHAIADNSWAHPGGMGAWVGDRMIVAAKNGAAEYDPAVDRWHDLPGLPDGASGFIGVTSSGPTLRALVHGAESGTVAVASYGPNDGAWTIGRSEPVPWALGPTDAISIVWADHELVAWDGVRAGWAYDPTTDAWRRLPDLVVATTEPVASSLAWVANELVAVLTYDDGSTAGTGLRAARLTGDQWQSFADGNGVAMPQPAPFDVGGNLVVLDRSGQGAPLRADPSTGRWSTVAAYPLVPGADGTAVSTGAGLFVWGGVPGGTPATFQNPSPTTPDSAWFTP
jgi:hypothetical protein